MIVSIHQPHFLPWLGYWNKALASDTFVWLDSVQYRKNYFQNRTRIKNVNGAPLWLTLPVHAHLGMPIRDVEIAESDWVRRITKTVEQCYRKTEFFETCWPPIEAALRTASSRLADVNLRAFRAVLSLLGEDRLRVVPIGELSADVDDPTERLVAACRALGATRYIAGKGGRNYLREEAFRAAGIDVVWQEFDPEAVVYPQGDGVFVPGLSVVDALFHVGPVRTRALIRDAWTS